jgi:hypothetical protein
MRSIAVCLVLAAVVVCAGCGRKERKERSAEADRLAQAEGKVEVLVDSGKLSDPDKLKGLLPKSLPGMKRLEKASGRKVGAIGRRVTRGEVSFEGAEGELVDMSITDASGAKGLAAVPDAEWLTKDVKEDTDTKFASVERKDGRRMYKEYNLNTRHGKVGILVGDRFVVEISGLNVEYQSIEALTNSIPFDTLERMAGAK